MVAGLRKKEAFARKTLRRRGERANPLPANDLTTPAPEGKVKE